MDSQEDTVILTRGEFNALCDDVIGMFLEYRDGYVTDDELQNGEDPEECARRICFRDISEWFDVIGSNKQLTTKD